jgi:DNA-binding NtrC family response regulator
MRSKWAAVLPGFHMPGESGLDLLSHVKSRYPGLPFVMTMGAQSSRLKHEAMKMGSNGYIEKPFQLKDLVKVIAAVPALADQGTEKLAS